MPGMTPTEEWRKRAESLRAHAASFRAAGDIEQADEFERTAKLADEIARDKPKATIEHKEAYPQPRKPWEINGITYKAWWKRQKKEKMRRASGQGDREK